MILILVAAAVLALALGKPGDAVAILAIVVLFVVLGVVQEHRAQKAIAALKQMSAPTVRAVRDGQVVEISAAELVPGDVVKLENGAVVPADCRVIESVNLRCQEAALTGESEPVEKTTAALVDPELTIGDRVNLAYMGTFVSFGRGTAVVVETGMRTELGTIASLIQGVRHDATPLQRKLDRLAKTLALVALAVAALVLLGDLLQGIAIHDGLLVAVAVAVAIVPEGLPAVLTFTLALGAQRMLRRKALIRKLPAVETLGGVTVICSDKTGTLTQNKMSVTVLDVAGHRIDLAALSGPGGAVAADAAPTVPPGPASTPFLLAAAALCNDATLDVDAASGLHTSVGDPTESALVLGAARFGLPKQGLEGALPRVAELPFDSERKRMTTVHRLPAGAAAGQALEDAGGVAVPPDLGEAPLLAVVKGAVDGLLARVTSVWAPEGVVAFDDSWKRRVVDGNETMGGQGMRVLAVAYRAATEAPGPGDHESFEQGLTLVGLVGMIDPPRPEARAAVARCTAAGIRTIMITGDHPLTARHIAADLGITTADGAVKTGVELERMSAAELTEAVGACNVFARVSPEHKLRLVDALKANGEVVAMTGDGVNDAPALKKADIGVEKGESNVMRRPPYRPDEGMFSRGFGWHVAWLGPFIGALVIAAAWWLHWRISIQGPLDATGRHVLDDAEEQHLITMVFLVLAIIQLTRVFGVRSFVDPVTSYTTRGNRTLMGLVAAAFALQMIAVYFPPTQAFFQTTGAVGWQGLALGLGLGAVVLCAMEVEKTIRRRRLAAAHSGGVSPPRSPTAP